MRDLTRQALALAGVFQAAALAKSFADRGAGESEALAGSINSIFAIDAESVLAVFGSEAGIQLGLVTLAENLDGNTPDTDLLRYAFNMVALAEKFRHRKDLQIAVREGIDATSQQLHHAEATHDTVLARLAQIYYHNISQLRPRIMVNGKPLYLQQERVVSQIRAVLLAGIRAGLLWHQVGGGKLRLLFGRKRLAGEARRLLA